MSGSLGFSNRSDEPPFFIHPYPYSIPSLPTLASTFTSFTDSLPPSILPFKKERFSPITELSQEITLLQREVFKTFQHKPEDTCASSIWEAYSDKCYSVEMIEERIAKLMLQAKHSLSADHPELENYGKKHKNIAKQARLVEGLKLQGLSVPIPHGMNSDSVRDFLKEHAPEVSSEWDALGKEYAAYQKTTPFFDEPESKSRLETIENGIKRAFQKAGKNSALFQKLVSPELIAWLKDVTANGDYLMVRSTGDEDSKRTKKQAHSLILTSTDTLSAF